MGNFLRSLSSFIGAQAEVTPKREPQAAASGDAIEARSSNVDQQPQPSARPLPLVAYAAAHEDLSAPKPRRSRAVSLLPSVATRHPVPPAGPLLTETERLRLQVMQAQIQLSTLRLYEGPIDGHLNPETATAVRHFQTLKGARATGTLTAGTLAALGIYPIA